MWTHRYICQQHQHVFKQKFLFCWYSVFLQKSKYFVMLLFVCFQVNVATPDEIIVLSDSDWPLTSELWLASHLLSLVNFQRLHILLFQLVFDAETSFSSVSANYFDKVHQSHLQQKKSERFGACLWLQDSYTMTVCLWREAAVYNLNVGDHISLSHMKWSQSSYDLQLHSTAFTRIVNKCLEIDSQIWHNIIYHHCCGHNRNAKPAGGFAGEWTKPVHWQWAVESLW